MPFNRSAKAKTSPRVTPQQAEEPEPKPWTKPSDPIVLNPGLSQERRSRAVALPDLGEHAHVMSPVHTLVNPDTGSTVTLVGNMHGGTREYYAELKAVLVELEKQGAMVHYEAVLPPSEAALLAAADSIRSAHEKHTQAVATVGVSYRSIGLVAKGDVFQEEPTWEAHDITTLDLIEFYGLKAARKFTESTAQPAELVRSGPDVVFAMLRKEFTDANRKLRQGIPRSEWEEPEMVRLGLYREAVAFGAADVHLARHPGSDLVQFWGCGHIPGFVAGWKARGYELRDEQWLTVVDFNTLRY